MKFKFEIVAVLVLIVVALSSIAMSETGSVETGDNSTIIDNNNTIEEPIPEEPIEEPTPVEEMPPEEPTEEPADEIILEGGYDYVEVDDAVNETIEETIPEEVIEETIPTEEQPETQPEETVEEETAPVDEIPPTEEISEEPVDEIILEEGYDYVEVDDVVEDSPEEPIQEPAPEELVDLDEVIPPEKEHKVVFKEQDPIFLKLSAPDEIKPNLAGKATLYVWNLKEEELNDVPVNIESSLEIFDNTNVIIPSIEPYSSAEITFAFSGMEKGIYDITAYSGDTSVTEKVKVRDPHSPLFSIDVSTPPIWPVGSTWDIYVDVYNGGNETAYNTVVTLLLSQGLSTTDPLIKSAGDLDFELPGSHVQLVWPVHVDTSGTHTVSANATCDNCNDASDSSEVNSTEEPELNFTQIVMPSELTVGQTSQVTAVIENNGAGDGNSTSVELTVPAELSIIGDSVKNVDVLAGTTQNVVFEVQADSAGSALSLNIRARHLDSAFDKTLFKSFITTIDDTEAPAFGNIVITPDPAGISTVTISFTASEALQANPTVTVNGNSASFSSKNVNDYVYTYDVTLADTEGLAAVAISGSDIAGNPGTGSGSFTIKTTLPEINQIITDDDNGLAIPGATILITASETNTDSGLTGKISVKEQDNFLITDASMTNQGNGDYTYSWSTTGYTKGNYELSVTLTDSTNSDTKSINFTLNNPPYLNKTIPQISYTSNTLYQIDLNQYFADVDNDVLTYNYVVNDTNITVDQDNNIFNLSNALDFIGVAEITFFASDENYTINSSTIVNVTPQADLFVSQLDINPTNPKENDPTTFTVTVNNSGPPDTGNFDVKMYIDGVLYDTKTTNVPRRSSSDVVFTTKPDWNNELGEHTIDIILDEANAIDETNETNNNFTTIMYVKQWQLFYGQTPETIALSDASDNNLNTWTVVSNGNVYVYKPTSTIDWNNLQALGRTVGGSASSNDYSEIDTALSMTGNDKLSDIFASPTPTSLAVYGTTINNIPVIDSTTNANFITGILWDTSDDSGDNEYSGSEDLVFVSQINLNKAGDYGTYDYEVRVPAQLRDAGGDVTIISEVI